MEHKLRTINLCLPDEAETEKFGHTVAKALKTFTKEIDSEGFVIRLDGDLGAGKTTLTRAILRGLGYERRVKSPTFALLEQYNLDSFLLNHFDFYRFETPEEFDEAGFRDNYGPGQVTISEWTQKAEPFVPDADIQIVLRNGSNDISREGEILAISNKGERFLEEVKNDRS